MADDILLRLKNLREATMRAEIESAQALIALKEAFGTETVEAATVLMQKLKNDHEKLLARKKALEQELDNMEWETGR